MKITKEISSKLSNYLVIFSKFKGENSIGTFTEWKGFELDLTVELRLLEMKRVESVQCSRPVASNSLQAHELQHARLPCPSPTPESTQTHVHYVSDAIQPSYPPLCPSPPTLNLSQYQGLFK